MYEWYLDNQSSDTLAIYFALGLPTSYPDTLLPANRNETLFLGTSKQTIYMTGISYEKTIKGTAKDTLSIFIMNVDTLRKYTWDEVRQNYKILQRYDFSLQDLRLLNYTIPYPPTMEMKNMKMYPPYGSEGE